MDSTTSIKGKITVEGELVVEAAKYPLRNEITWGIKRRREGDRQDDLCFRQARK
jgi:hypothetical protein